MLEENVVLFKSGIHDFVFHCMRAVDTCDLLFGTRLGDNSWDYDPLIPGYAERLATPP